MEVFAEYVDEGVSGVRESRPRLDAMLKDAKRRRFDTVTLDTYSHVLPALQQEAAREMDAILGARRN